MNPAVDSAPVKNWIGNRIKEDENAKYLSGGKDFIDDAAITALIREKTSPDRLMIRDIIAKASSIERLEPEETAALLNVADRDLWDEIFDAAGKVKKAVYDN